MDSFGCYDHDIYACDAFVFIQRYAQSFVQLSAKFCKAPRVFPRSYRDP
jgi:hypothetical protein